MTGTATALSKVDEWQLAVLNIRLQGARDAINRSRLAFIAAIIASLSIFIVEWNAYLSWYRRFPLREEFPKNEVTTEAIKKVIQQYVESRVINISLLGIHVAVSDLAVLGTLALFIFSIWLFFSVRRENHAIGSLLIDTAEQAEEIRRFVYYGISPFLIFTTSTSSDAPISSLHKEEQIKRQNRPQSISSRLLRIALVGLCFLPALIAISTIIFDMLSLYVVHAAFSFPHAPLGFNDLKLADKIRVITMEVIALGFSIPTAYICVKILRFEESLASILRSYAQTFNR